MKTNKKWLCFASLSLAGLLSLCLSAFGGIGLLWSGSPQKDHSSFLLAVFLPLLLAFPMFALAVGVSRFAKFVLWVAVPFPWLAVFETSIHDFNGEPTNFLKFLAESTHMALPLLILAALVQFGTQFYEFTHDSSWVRWKMEKHETTVW